MMCDIANPERKLYYNSKLICHSNAEVDIHGITVTETGDVLICDVNNKQVCRYDSAGKFAHACKLEHYPRDIVVLPDTEEAVVTLQESRFSRKPGYLGFIDTSIMRLQKEVPCKCTPFGITNIGDSIAVGSWNVIQLYDSAGEFQKTVNVPEDRVAVKYLKRRNDGSILYITSSLNCIGKDGEVIFKLAIQIGSPRGFCIGNDKYIYLSNSNGQIICVSDSGVPLGVVFNDEDNSLGPLNVMCFNNDFSKLYIATNDGSSLSVFYFK